jgi:hypothetical protein
MPLSRSKQPPQLLTESQHSPNTEECSHDSTVVQWFRCAGRRCLSCPRGLRSAQTTRTATAIAPPTAPAPLTATAPQPQPPHSTRTFLAHGLETASATAHEVRSLRSPRPSGSHLLRRAPRAVPTTSSYRACGLRPFRAFPLVYQLVGIFPSLSADDRAIMDRNHPIGRCASHLPQFSPVSTLWHPQNLMTEPQCNRIWHTNIWSCAP